MSITPGKNNSVLNLHGTIYKRKVDSNDSNLIYHCHSPISKQAIESNPVWTVFRENLSTGQLVTPIDNITGNPKPDKNRYDNVENLTYWELLAMQNGFIDYNDTTGSFSILADTWTDIPNNGLGAFTNKNYLPSNVTELMDTSTGYIDTTELNLGDSIFIRNDYEINPTTNNALLKFRYVLGTGLSEYTLEKIIGRLDSGSGIDYRFSLSPDFIYMGDTNTKDNPIKIQVNCTSAATVTNAGSVIQVIKR